jgi:hypothetical protein
MFPEALEGSRKFSIISESVSLDLKIGINVPDYLSNTNPAIFGAGLNALQAGSKYKRIFSEAITYL